MAEHFQVISQRQTVGRLPDDSYGPVVTITFRTVSGVVQSVNVPVEGYSAAGVRDAIEARIVEIEAINNL